MSVDLENYSRKRTFLALCLSFGLVLYLSPALGFPLPLSDKTPISHIFHPGHGSCGLGPRKEANPAIPSAHHSQTQGSLTPFTACPGPTLPPSPAQPPEGQRVRQVAVLSACGSMAATAPAIAFSSQHARQKGGTIFLHPCFIMKGLFQEPLQPALQHTSLFFLA